MKIATSRHEPQRQVLGHVFRGLPDFVRCEHQRRVLHNPARRQTNDLEQNLPRLDNRRRQHRLLHGDPLAILLRLLRY